MKVVSTYLHIAAPAVAFIRSGFLVCSWVQPFKRYCRGFAFKTLLALINDLLPPYNKRLK